MFRQTESLEDTKQLRQSREMRATVLIAQDIGWDSAQSAGQLDVLGWKKRKEKKRLNDKTEWFDAETVSSIGAGNKRQINFCFFVCVRDAPDGTGSCGSSVKTISLSLCLSWEKKKKKKKSFPGSTVDVHSPDMHTGRSHAVNIVTKLPHRPDKVTHSARREQLYKKISEIVKKTHPGHLWNDRVPRLSRFTRRRTVGTGVDADTETEQLYL